MKVILSLFVLLIVVISGYALFSSKKANPYISQEPEVLVIPLGLPPIPWPADNPYAKNKADLGQLLYFDKRLSTDGTISCASCHSIPRAFTDGKPIAQGIEGRMGTRHSPTVIDAAYQTHLFWDGRANTLEEQCKGPIANPKEMTLVVDDVHEAHRQCQEHIMKIEGYKPLFRDVFGKETCESDTCTIEQISKAIATFERTVLSGNSPYDKYMSGDLKAMTEEQIYGLKVFNHVGCANCHFGPIFSNGRFLNIGVGMDKENPDLGRYMITHDPKDWGAFKVSTLREVEHTAPYMHDGSIKTLEEVVDYYDRGGIPNSNLHPLLKPLHLTDKDKKALVSFMKALSGEGWQHFKEPKKFP